MTQPHQLQEICVMNVLKANSLAGLEVQPFSFDEKRNSFKQFADCTFLPHRGAKSLLISVAVETFP